jgi:hypothetical protein
MQKFKHNIGFWEKHQFFRQKLSKIVIITSTPGRDTRIISNVALPLTNLNLTLITKAPRGSIFRSVFLPRNFPITKFPLKITRKRPAFFQTNFHANRKVRT